MADGAAGDPPGSERDQAAQQRDMSAEQRDHAAAQRDQSAYARDAQTTGTRTATSQQAARDRDAAAKDRVASRHDREDSTCDREAASADRADAQQATLEHDRSRTYERLHDRELLAGDLHQTVIHQLHQAGLMLDSAESLSCDPAVTERLAAAAEILDSAMANIRRAVFDLEDADGAQHQGR
jgi:signal transduction histidine kinase